MKDFKTQGLMSMLVIREEVRNDSVREGIDDVKDTCTIGVSLVRVVCGGLVVLGLSVVDSGNALRDRGLEYTRWFYFGAIKDFSASFPGFTLAFGLGSYPC